MKKRLFLIFLLFVAYTLSCQAQNPILWGTTGLGGSTFFDGTLFKYSIATDSETNMHNFGIGTDGSSPSGSLIQATNGLLYGVAQFGGINGDGIIFSYNISTNTETDVHDFGSDTDGIGPNSTLIQASNGLLYGLTESGGIKKGGTLFSYNISTGIETDIHDFSVDSNGDLTEGSLIHASNNLLYGVTFSGGINDDGVIFSYNIITNNYTILYNFGNDTDGRLPAGSLIEVTDSLLYGNTTAGGANDRGIIFSYNIKTGKETDLYDFGSGTDGWSPSYSLFQLTMV